MMRICCFFVTMQASIWRWRPAVVTVRSSCAYRFRHSSHRMSESTSCASFINTVADQFRRPISSHHPGLIQSDETECAVACFYDVDPGVDSFAESIHVLCWEFDCRHDSSRNTRSKDRRRHKLTVAHSYNAFSTKCIQRDTSPPVDATVYTIAKTTAAAAVAAKHGSLPSNAIYSASRAVSRTLLMQVWHRWLPANAVASGRHTTHTAN